MGRLVPIGLVALAAAAAACNDVPDTCLDVEAPDDRFAVTLAIVDEDDRPIAGARIAAAGIDAATTGADGRAALADLAGPIVAIVSRDGYLAEPVPLGWDDDGDTLAVRLWRAGAGRFVLHAGGDVMFGRRYEEPVEGDPLIPREDAAAGAERVVAAIAPVFAIADLGTVNLETVVSDLPASAAYPGKRFILRSRPDTLAALDALGVDVATLANNHARDFLDPGIADTRAALTAAGLPLVGAAGDEATAGAPWRGRVGGTTVAIAAYTTVNGSFVNDQLPEDADAREAGAEDWQYERRTWGFDGGEVTVETALRRIGSAWRAFVDAEPLAGDELGPLWGSLAEIYPEAQDWVARRGHGGAAAWIADESPAQITRLAVQNQLVVVELHAGFQFQEASSDNVRAVARRAIDAGADLVVCHHPHVLQGVEWYKGKLIAYSLGNFVFDQDFLSTLASVFLRTVWQGDTLLEARLVPIEIAAYRPVPLVGAAARRVLAAVWERGLLRAASTRGSDGAVRALPIELDAHTAEADVVVERGTGRIVAGGGVARTLDVEVAPGAVEPLATDDLVVPRPLEADGPLEIGRDLFGWGAFEDDLADDAQGGDTHWALDSCQEAVVWGDAAEGRGALRLRRTLADAVLARPVARVPLPRHRLYTADEPAVGLDGAPAYSIALRARRSGDAPLAIRVVLYHFDDTDPTEDPASVELATLELPLEIPDDDAWHEVALEVAHDAFAAAERANMVMIYVVLGRPERNEPTVLDVDALRFLEWRDADAMPEQPGAWRFVRTSGGRAVEARFAVRAAR